MNQPAAESIDLRFPLRRQHGWPPSDVEHVAAVMAGADAAEILGVPIYVDGVSVGDVVRVERDGTSFVAGPVVRRGRHSTVRVVSSRPAVLVELQRLLPVPSRTMAGTGTPAVMAVDVADGYPLEDVLVLLDGHCSMNLTYTVSCLQHRLTPHAPHDTGIGRGELDELVSRQELQDPVQVLDLDVRGRVVRPGDDGWDAARSAWNLAVDQRPAIVVEPADAFDVQAVVRYAAVHGLRVAPQATGHNAAPLGDLSDAILLRTGRMSAIEVDPRARSVRVGAGAIWADVSAALLPHGLVALAGSSPDVGVAGYALGGGYSWLGRRHGLASSSITAVELVTGDATFHRVDADTEPELFWAVRGGGANVGVVCALELAVLPIPEVYAGALMFPLARAVEILPAYEEWTRDLDESATTCIRLLRLPPLPEIPEPLRGNAFVMVDGAIEAEPERAAELLAPLRSLGPVLDSFAPMPAGQLSAIHLDPPAPVPVVGDGLALADLTPQTIEVLLAHAGPAIESALLAVDLRHLGGALGRPDPRGGAVDHLPGRFLLFAVGIAPTPEAAGRVRDEVSSLVAALEPWASPQDYLNFREVPVPPGRLYPAGHLARLRALRAEHDPAGLLSASHPV